jgi:hypothetical protein
MVGVADEYALTLLSIRLIWPGNVFVRKLGARRVNLEVAECRLIKLLVTQLGYEANNNSKRVGGCISSAIFCFVAHSASEKPRKSAESFSKRKSSLSSIKTELCEQQTLKWSFIFQLSTEIQPSLSQLTIKPLAYQSIFPADSSSCSAFIPSTSKSRLKLEPSPRRQWSRFITGARRRLFFLTLESLIKNTKLVITFT